MRVPDRRPNRDNIDQPSTTIRCSDGTKQQALQLGQRGRCPKGASPMRLQSFID